MIRITGPAFRTILVFLQAECDLVARAAISRGPST